MKKCLRLYALLSGLMLFPVTALAALPELYLYSPALDTMTYLEYESFDNGYCESYLSEDGLISAEVLAVAAAEYGMVGEGSLAELMELRTGNELDNFEEIVCDSIGSYPAQRIRFETGANEDASVVDASAVWTDSRTFVFIVTVSADAWYGYMDGYEDGAAQAMVDTWISELQVEGYDSGEWDYAQTDVVLIADRSCGSENAEELKLVERYDVMIEGEVDANALADALSWLTRLDFFVDCYYDENDMFVVDWMADSTLTAGLDDRVQYEDFFFFDAVSLNWFMMDSLYATIRENLGIEEVYYTMNGGMDLVPTELGILDSLPADVPYMGSAFYFAHSDVMGDDSADDAYGEDIYVNEYYEDSTYADDMSANDASGAEVTDFEDNDFGFFDNYIDTEFFRVGVPAFWRDIYEYEIVQNEPFGYTIIFSEKESGFVFSLEARWFDDEIVQLESVWQGYLGRMNVERLGALDLLVLYSQPAPDASDAWQTMYDTCREVAEALIMQEGVVLEAGEYVEYEA